MSHRTSILGLALFFLVAPILCSAGVVIHECVCSDNVCCETSEDEGCDADPCGELLAARGEADPLVPADPPAEISLQRPHIPFADSVYISHPTSTGSLRLPTAAVIRPILI